jgi:hypothetical protein
VSEDNTGNSDNKGSIVVLGLRVLQIICMALAVVGFIWSTGDYLSSLFPPDSVVTPFSVLLLLYGSVGAVGIEGSIKFLKRKK